MEMLLASNPQTPFTLRQLSWYCPLQPEDPVQKHELHLVLFFFVSCLKQFLNLSLTFLILAHLKITVVCIKSPKLVFPRD